MSHRRDITTRPATDLKAQKFPSYTLHNSKTMSSSTSGNSLSNLYVPSSPRHTIYKRIDRADETEHANDEIEEEDANMNYSRSPTKSKARFNKHPVQHGFTAFNNRNASTLYSALSSDHDAHYYDTPPLTSNRGPRKNVNLPSSPLVDIQCNRGKEVTSSLTMPYAAIHHHPSSLLGNLQLQSLSSPEVMLANGQLPDHKFHQHEAHVQNSEAEQGSVLPENDDGRVDDLQEHSVSSSDELLSSPQYFEDNSEDEMDSSMEEANVRGGSFENERGSWAPEKDSDESDKDMHVNDNEDEQIIPTTVYASGGPYDRDFKTNSSKLQPIQEQGVYNPMTPGRQAPGPRKPTTPNIGITPPSVTSNALHGYYIPGIGVPPTPRFEDLVMLYGLGAPIPREAVSPTMGTKAAERIRDRLRTKLKQQEAKQESLRRKSMGSPVVLAQSLSEVTDAAEQNDESASRATDEAETIRSSGSVRHGIKKRAKVAKRTTFISESPTESSSEESVESYTKSSPYSSTSEVVSDSQKAEEIKELMSFGRLVNPSSPRGVNSRHISEMLSSPPQHEGSVVFKNSASHKPRRLVDEEEDDDVFMPAITATSGVKIFKQKITRDVNELLDRNPNVTRNSLSSNGFGRNNGNTIHAVSTEPNENTIARRSKSRKTKSMPPGTLPPPASVLASPITSIPPRIDQSRVCKRRSLARISPTKRRARKSTGSFPPMPTQGFGLPFRPSNFRSQRSSEDFNRGGVSASTLANAMRRINRLECENAHLRNESISIRHWADSMYEIVDSINSGFAMAMDALQTINAGRQDLMTILEHGPSYGRREDEDESADSELMMEEEEAQVRRTSSLPTPSPMQTTRFISQMSGGSSDYVKRSGSSKRVRTKQAYTNQRDYEAEEEEEMEGEVVVDEEEERDSSSYEEELSGYLNEEEESFQATSSCPIYGDYNY